jgi:hypothetical protein
MVENFEERLNTAIRLLKGCVLTTVPPEFVQDRVRTVRDIYENRSVLKRLPGTDGTVSHIANIILAAVRARGRMRTLDCLKVLRSLIRNTTSGEAFRPATVHVLFEIYKHYIFDGSEELQWCISAIVKDQLLDDEAVDWLLANENQSEHIVNRLLLFPTAHPKIKAWAKRAYQTNAFPDRQYQVVALLIEKDLPSYVEDEESNTILWAIHKARIPEVHKVALINKYSDLDSVESLVKIADQMENKEIIVHLLSKLEAMCPS